LNFFSLGVTAEALRAIIGSKSAISLQRGPVDSKFQVEGVALDERFAWLTIITPSTLFIISPHESNYISWRE